MSIKLKTRVNRDEYPGLSDEEIIDKIIDEYIDSGVKSILLTLRNLHLENLTQTPNNLQSVV